MLIDSVYWLAFAKKYIIYLREEEQKFYFLGI